MQKRSLVLVGGVLGCLSVFFWGCEDELPSGTLATVAGRDITREDVITAAHRMLGEKVDVDSLPPAEWKRVLDALVAAELLDMEGKERGLDRDPDLLRGLEDLQRRLLNEEYYARDIWKDLNIPEEEVRARFVEWGSGEQLHLAHILCADRESAIELMAELKKGEESFGRLARLHSLHAESAPAGGDMGFMHKGAVFPEVWKAVQGLSPGEVYKEPIHTSLGYQIVRLLGRRRQSFEEQKEPIEEGLRNEKKRRLEKEARDRLKRDYDLEWNPEIALRMAQKQELPEDQTLYRWKGGEFRAADYVRRAKVAQPVFDDTARIHQSAERLVMAELICQAALAQGYGDLEKVRTAMEKERRRLVAEKLFRTEAAGKERTEEELRSFYEENREKYRGPKRVTVREILVKEQATADSLYSLIAGGASIEELARKHTMRSFLREQGGLWENVPSVDPRSLKIYQTALEKKGLVSPVKVPGGWSVFEVLSVEEGRVLEFEEIEKGVRRDMTVREMDAFIERLKEKFADKISYY